MSHYIVNQMLLLFSSIEDEKTLTNVRMTLRLKSYLTSLNH